MLPNPWESGLREPRKFDLWQSDVPTLLPRTLGTDVGTYLPDLEVHIEYRYVHNLEISYI